MFIITLLLLCIIDSCRSGAQIEIWVCDIVPWLVQIMDIAGIGFNLILMCFMRSAVTSIEAAELVLASATWITSQ